MPDIPSKPATWAGARRGTQQDNRREVPRYSLIASAEQTDLATETRLTGRISELSLKGGYIDTLNPFPKDSMIRLVITHHNMTFTATAKVIYPQQNMGMGIRFETIEPEQMEVLQKWLTELEI